MHACYYHSMHNEKHCTCLYIVLCCIIIERRKKINFPAICYWKNMSVMLAQFEINDSNKISFFLK